MNRREFLAASAAGMVVRPSGFAQSEAAAPVAGGFSTSAYGWTVPRPMFWSFDNKDPRVDMAGYTMSFQVYVGGADENTYSIDAKSVETKLEGNRWTLMASQLSWPGQQATARGTLTARATLNGDVVLLDVSATAPENVIAIKVVVHGLPPQSLVAQTGWQVTPDYEAVTREGVLHSYPRYTGGMPVWFLGSRDTSQGKGISFSSMDVTTAPKRFCAALTEDGIRAELIAECDARKLGTSYTAPTWELKRNTTLGEAVAARQTMLEAKAGLATWETRKDVAAWARDVSLVVTLHGMHWSGYVFNDYDTMLDRVKWVTERIDGKKVMFFLAGWEGRYYRQYGDSRAEPRMGGAEGLKALVQGIHAKGAHVMAMFAGNAAGPVTPGLDELRKNSGFHGLPDGFDYSPMRGYAVDWAEIRAKAGEGGAWLNPGAAGWRDHLLQQVGELNETYGFDGNFFDTQPNAANDFKNNPLEGLRMLADGLRAKKPELLLATESWYDLSLGVIPCSQTPDGPGHWSRKYQRRFAHLALGEPSRGSTGVHEVGHVDYDALDLLETFDLPTLSVVDTTIGDAPDAAQKMIDTAKAMKA